MRGGAFGRFMGGCAAVVCAALLAKAAPSFAHNADDDLPRLKGNYEKGSLRLDLNRGAAVPLELTVIDTPSPDGSIELKLDWDEEENEVRVRLHGKNVLERYPDVDRVPGVNFLENPWFPEPEDIVDGRYQLWIVTTGRMLTFYYDPTTLDLMGSDLDFETPPAAIPVPFPSLRLFGSPFFQPKPNGDLNFEWTFDYDQVRRGDLPHLSEYYLTFPPPNLCGANPYRVDLSALRPYGSKPLPLSEAPSFSEYLRGGFLFDITVEPAAYFTDRAIQTGIGSYSQSTLVAGAIPKGWTMDIDAAFGNNAPPIRPWAGAGASGLWTPPFHHLDANFCP